MPNLYPWIDPPAQPPARPVEVMGLEEFRAYAGYHWREFIEEHDLDSEDAAHLAYLYYLEGTLIFPRLAMAPDGRPWQ